VNDVQRFDVVVVGGGPAGAAVARDVAAAGFRVAILERDQRVGQPIQCSGLVTERTLAAAGLDSSMAMNALTGAIVFSPRGTRYAIGGDRVHAHILDRSQFDQRLMAQALDAGSILWTGTRATAIERHEGEIEVHTERSGHTLALRARLIIGADGPRSLVAEFLDLPAPSEVLRARGADVLLSRQTFNDQVLLFLGQRYSHGFFAWAIPISDEKFRIGWALGQSARDMQQLECLTADYPDIFDGMRILTQTGGLIPLGPRARTYGENGMVVGDAAGQAKPTSGGGLYTSLRCAAHCARVAISSLESDNTSASRLAEYDRAWRADVGAELLRGTVLRKGFRDLSDVDIEWGLRLLHVPGVRHLVDRYGDIDFPSQLATAALRAVPPLLHLVRRRPEILDDMRLTDLLPVQPMEAK
jgi:digeranylgeranylglycerophospholipid reductase